MRRAVREMAQAGADFIKTAASGGFWGKHEGLHLPNYTQEELDALVDEAHSWNMLVGAHAHAQPGLQRAVNAGVDLIYHGCLMDRPAQNPENTAMVLQRGKVEFAAGGLQKYFCPLDEWQGLRDG